MSISVLRRIVCAIACCALVLSAGCDTKPEIIRIGAILPLSGAGGDIGNQHLHGLQLAIEELNASNPDVQYELVVDSDQNDPGAALAAFKDQLLTKKILISFVIARSSCLAVARQAEKEFVPVFANCIHPLMTSMYLSAFRNVPNTALEIKTTARFLTASLKVDRAAALYFNNDDGSDAAKAFKNELPQSGIRLLATEPFIDDVAAVKSAVSMALAQDPGAVFVFGAGKAAAGVLAALRAAGFQGAVVGSSDFRDPALLFRSLDRALGEPGFRREVLEEIQRGANGERRLRVRRDANRREGSRYQTHREDQHHECVEKSRRFRRPGRQLYVLRAGMAPADEDRPDTGRRGGRRPLTDQRRMPI
jgi:hypothetical protein